MSRFKPEDRVILKADEEEGWPEEKGTVLCTPGKDDVYVISVDDEYLIDGDDDGIREVSEDQLLPLDD